MAKYTIQWLEQKRSDWYQVSLIDETGGKHLNVSINELDRNTRKPAWENWKDMKAGDTLEGNLWTSSKGSVYLYPSKEDTNANGVVVRASGGFNKSAGIAKAQEVKRHDIEMAQSNKEHSIRTASTASGATQIVSALIAQGRVDNVEDEWDKWRKFLWDRWDVAF